MAIVRESDPRVGCLAVPVSTLAGFVVTVLLAAALGASAGSSVALGLAGGAVAMVIAGWFLKR